MRRILGALCVMLLVAAAVRADVAITTCGTLVSPGDTGVLAGDLDCGGASPGVILGRSTTLVLNGFSIRNAADPAVDCVDGACAVLGGPASEISDCAGDGIRAGSPAQPSRRRVTVSDLRIRGCDGSGIEAPMATVVATAVETSGNGAHGIHARKVRATDVLASANGLHGVVAMRKVLAAGITAEANGANGINAFEGRVRVAGALVTGNTHAGIAARLLDLEAGTVTANNTGAFGIDLFVVRPPHVRDTVCGQSRQLLVVGGQIQAGPTWGVCAGD